MKRFVWTLLAFWLYIKHYRDNKSQYHLRKHMTAAADETREFVQEAYEVWRRWRI